MPRSVAVAARTMPGVTSTTRTADRRRRHADPRPATGRRPASRGPTSCSSTGSPSTPVATSTSAAGWRTAGLDVTGYDLRGFGASGGRRAWVDAWGRHHDDLEERLAAIRADAPRSAGRALRSLAGRAGRARVRRRRPGAAAAGRPRPERARDRLVAAPLAEDGCARSSARVAPTFEVKNAFDGTILSRDPSVAERYLADPLNYHRTTTRFGADAIAEQARVLAARDRLSIPTLVDPRRRRPARPDRVERAARGVADGHPAGLPGAPPREPQRARGRAGHRRRRRLAPRRSASARVPATEYRLRGARER